MHITKNVCESLLGTLLNMPDRTKDGPKARNDLMALKIRKGLHLPPDRTKDDQPEEETTTDGRKRKRVNKQHEYNCPLLLHSMSQRGRSIFQLPSRSQSALGLRGSDKKIPGPE